MVDQSADQKQGDCEAIQVNTEQVWTGQDVTGDVGEGGSGCHSMVVGFHSMCRALSLLFREGEDEKKKRAE